MGIKKIEEMDHYEILNIKKSASQQEIHKAYSVGKSAYSFDSMAHYTLLSEHEREEMIDRIEHAFQILGNPDRRKDYDTRVLSNDNFYREKAYFRQSTERLVIEDVNAGRKWVENLKRFFFSSGKN